jgi:hypothetical protein
MQIMSLFLSGAGLLAGGIAFLVWMGVNGMYLVLNLFTFKPTPYLWGSYASVFVACALVEAAFMVRLHWGSVAIPWLPLLWAWHLGMIGR